MSPPSLDHLRRYAPLLEADEIDAFVEAARRPLPRVVWANPLRGDPVETAREVEALVAGPDRGGVVTFTGCVRDHTGEHGVVRGGAAECDEGEAAALQLAVLRRGRRDGREDR